MRRLSYGPILALTPFLLAQGTAPNQGVTRPTPPPAAQAPPPAPPASQQGDGEPRRDAGSGATSTAPNSTATTPLPPPRQADPSPRR